MNKEKQAEKILYARQYNNPDETLDVDFRNFCIKNLAQKIKSETVTYKLKFISY